MEQKKNLKKYLLVYEPNSKGQISFSRKQSLVNFSSDDPSKIEVFDVEAYKGLLDPDLKKHTLSEIDKFTTPYYDIHDLLLAKNHFDVADDCFIAMPVSGYVIKVSPAFMNIPLYNKTSLVNRDCIRDVPMIHHWIERILHDSQFLKDISNKKNVIPKSLISLMWRASLLQREADLGALDNSDYVVVKENYDRLFHQLSYYPYYREFFIHETQEKLKKSCVISNNLGVAEEISQLSFWEDQQKRKTKIKR